MPSNYLHRTVRKMGMVYKLQGTITKVVDHELVMVTWDSIVKDGQILPLGAKPTYSYCIQELEILEWSAASQVLVEA